MGKNFWMFVSSPDEYNSTQEMGLTVYGVGPRYRRRAERMQPDDRVLFYVNQIRKWTATATITSASFEDRTPLWTQNGLPVDKPYRVKLEPNIILDEINYIDALILAPRLDYVKRWPPEDWPLAFTDALHLLPQRDFRLIEGEMKRFSNRQRRGGNNRRTVPRNQSASHLPNDNASDDDIQHDQSPTEDSSTGSR